jgi:hypothetical protein
MTRFAKAWAASKKTGSFNVVNACRGVLVRTRRTVQYSRLGASKTVILGYGDVRLGLNKHGHGWD